MEQGFYHPSVGYWQATNAPSPEILATYPQGTVEVPLIPGSGYTFDGAQWVAPSQSWLDDQAAKVVRSERLRRLVLEIDPLVSNPLRWNDLTAEKREEWVSYRTALLNITAQTGFPHTVVWPVKP
jgi:hypothetical protein